MNKNSFLNPDTLFEQLTAISKAGAYDAIMPAYVRILEENATLKKRVQFLEELINEYALRMKANLSGGKVDQFLKDQSKDAEVFELPAVDQEIEQEMKDHDDLQNVL